MSHFSRSKTKRKTTMMIKKRPNIEKPEERPSKSATFKLPPTMTSQIIPPPPVAGFKKAETTKMALETPKFGEAFEFPECSIPDEQSRESDGPGMFNGFNLAEMCQAQLSH